MRHFIYSKWLLFDGFLHRTKNKIKKKLVLSYYELTEKGDKIVQYIYNLNYNPQALKHNYEEQLYEQYIIEKIEKMRQLDEYKDMTDDDLRQIVYYCYYKIYLYYSK